MPTSSVYVLPKEKLLSLACTALLCFASMTISKVFFFLRDTLDRSSKSQVKQPQIQPTSLAVPKGTVCPRAVDGMAPTQTNELLDASAQPRK